MPIGFRLVLLDFDGTLVDTSIAICEAMRRSFMALGLPLPDDKIVKSTIGLSLDESMRRLCAALGCEFHDELPGKYRQIYDVEGLGLKLTLPYPGAYAALQTIRASGSKIAVVSNKGEEAVNAALRLLGLDAFVHFTAGEHPQFRGKPSVDPFLRTLKDLNLTIPPQDVLIAGDTATDVSFARNVGAPICWARYGYSHEDLRATSDLDYIIDSPEQLVGIVVGDREGWCEVAHA